MMILLLMLSNFFLVYLTDICIHITINYKFLLIAHFSICLYFLFIFMHGNTWFSSDIISSAYILQMFFFPQVHFLLSNISYGSS